MFAVRICPIFISLNAGQAGGVLSGHDPGSGALQHGGRTGPVPRGVPASSGCGTTRQSFLVSCCCIALFSVICIQILVLSAYISPTQDIAYVVATVYVMFSMLWAGLFVKLRELLAPLRAISYITPCRYASQIIIRQQFVNTTKQSTLKVFDLEVPDSINFAAIFAIYAVLLALTLLALRNLCRAKGK
eukprot:jgi/Botrbrau1/3033/Bobra.0070s0029.1